MSNFQVCTQENPYDPKTGEGKHWGHPDAVEIDESYGLGGGVADGDYVRYECPHCKLKFWVELPN